MPNPFNQLDEDEKEQVNAQKKQRDEEMLFERWAFEALIAGDFAQY